MLGGVNTSAVTTELMPKLESAPRMRPQENARYYTRTANGGLVRSEEMIVQLP